MIGRIVNFSIFIVGSTFMVGRVFLEISGTVAYEKGCFEVDMKVWFVFSRGVSASVVGF